MQLPDALLDSLHGIEGYDEIAFREIHNNPSQITSIRFNPDKLPSAFKLPPKENKIPWSSFGFYLDERPAFTFDPHFHGGLYYVQEASGMFLEEILKQFVDLNAPVKVLDLCAAPGGKSTLVQSVICKDSLVVSNDVIKSRVNILIENLIKWGGSNIVVTNNDPEDFSILRNFFDVLIIDAPCSGSGLIRRDPGALREWSPNNVDLCSQRQQRILSNVYPCLKQNGLLIYSTCSYSREENEDILEWMMNNFPVTTLRPAVKKEWGIEEIQTKTKKAYCYRFFPYKVKGEGFFVGCLKKMDHEQDVSESFSKQKLNIVSTEEMKNVQRFIEPNKLLLFFHAGKIVAFPSRWMAELQKLIATLYIRKAGVSVGKLAGNELVPDHELAVSTVLKDTIVGISLKIEDAIQYLRRGEVRINPEFTGWNVVKFENTKLGWVKVLKNRINNYYPVQWRILKTTR